MGDYVPRSRDHAGNSTVAMSKAEKRVYYTLFSFFLLFNLWYGFYSTSWGGSAYSMILCFGIAWIMDWAIHALREEKIAETLEGLKE